MKKAIIALFILPMMVFATVSFVYDTANVLSATQIQAINDKLYAFEQASSHEIAVVIVPSLEGDYIEHYAVKKFEELKPGKAEKDNGLLLLVAIEERELRIEVGYGLEPYITDAEAQQVINSVIVPAFKEGNYYKGIDNGIDALIGLTNGTYTPSKTPSFNVNPELILFAFFLLYGLFSATKSWWLGGVVGGIIGTIIAFFVGSLLYSGFVIVGSILLGLLLDFIASKSGGRGMHFWGGGGSSHGGGFGGFGGGMSGGGGASGRW